MIINDDYSILKIFMIKFSSDKKHIIAQPFPNQI